MQGCGGFPISCVLQVSSEKLSERYDLFKQEFMQGLCYAGDKLDDLKDPLWLYNR